MKKSEIKLIVLELLTIIILLLNIFVKNILNEYMLCILIGLGLGISIFLVGFEKSKTLEKSKIVHSPIKIPTIPIIPNNKNKIPDNFCIVFSEIYLFKNFPNKMAIKSHATIAQMAPAIKAILL